VSTRTTLILSCLCLLMLMACQTTTDPCKGGLFSYNPEAYEKRIEERTNTLRDLEEQKKTEKQKSEELQSVLYTKNAEKDDLTANIAALEKNIAQLKHIIEQTRLDTQKYEKEIERIHLESQSLEEELAQMQLESGNIEEKNKEIDRLQKRIDELLHEAEALSHM